MTTRKIFIAALTSGIVSATLAVPASYGGKLDLRARGMVIKKTADGIRVRVLTKDGASVAPGQRFKAGDEIEVELQSNFDGYVYIINVEEGGKRYLLFPYAGQINNRIAADAVYRLPRGGMISFDERPGVEVLQVIMSHDPIAALDAALKNPACAGGEVIRCEIEGGVPAGSPKTAPSRPEPTGIIAANVSPALSAEEAGGIRGRGITYGAGKDKNEGSFVAVIDRPGKGGKLASGQMAAFEIRLKHN